jgi:hypothetical protein
MIASLLISSTGSLFFFAATPENRWWMAGAWLVWIAFSGLNVCLPNLVLKIAPRNADTSYIATFYALCGLCMAASSIIAGAILQAFSGQTIALLPGWPALDYYHAAFLLGWIARSLGVVLVWWIAEDAPKE